MNPAATAKAFQEITPPLKTEEAYQEANRCLYCYDAPCIQACPTHIDVPRFIKQIASRNTIGSAMTILEANPMGHSCARVCPVEALCEGACVYWAWQQKPIQIGRLQRHATDFLHSKRLQPFEAGPDNGKKVAIVGAGPAGLSCATYLRRLGFAVTLFEAKPKPGGLNTYGIAEYKMTQETSLDEAAWALDLGVEIRCGTRVGEDISFDRLEKEFDAVFLGVGLGATETLGIAGEGLHGIHEALQFIEYIKNHEFSQIPPGKTTICIGAGNTAVDVVTQAKRLGTPRVVMAYRRGPEEMPAYDYEYELAKADAVEFLWNVTPVAILGKTRVEAVRFAKTHSLKGKLTLLPRSEFDIPCDRVVKAIGQKKRRDLLSLVADLELDAKGRVRVDPVSLETTNPRFFAGGDAVNGGSEVVNAAADGKRAALGIFRYLFPGSQPNPEHAAWIDTIEPTPKKPETPHVLAKV
ncbi:MAG: NAD(P)-dependent oxidoreductase [Elusimicrobia bacterium]|nr:NAD(P)-dependent oxidoreductase [Elusimicrobiota bacterium]